MTGRPFRDLLHCELFQPAGMTATSLGLGGRKIAGTAQCQVEEKTNWDWNSAYWRDPGVPWGGAPSTAADVTRLLGVLPHPERPDSQRGNGTARV